MRSISQILSALIVILFSVVGAFSLFTTTAELTLFQPEPYLNALESQEFFERFPVLLASLTSSQDPPDPEGDENQLRYLNRDDYAMIYTVLFPPEWTRREARSVLQQLFDHLNTRSPELQLVVNLQEVKARLASDAGSQIASRVVNSWPPCTAQQLLEIAGLGLTGQLQGFPTCRPPAELMGLANPLLEFSVRGFAGTLPDQADLADLIPVRGRDGRLAPSRTATYNIFRWSLRLMSVLAVSLLVVLLIVGVRSWKDLLVWLGTALGGAGLLGLALAFLAGIPLLMGVLGLGLGGLRIDLGDEMTQALLGAGRSLAQTYLLWVGVEAGFFLVAGVALLVAWSLIRGSNSRVL